jgi:murein DD-endopeptidase MepM/ murein hydrolase activator NlpD
MRKPSLTVVSVAAVVIVVAIAVLSVMIIPRLGKEPAAQKPPVKQHLAYKINLDSLEINYGTVKEGQNLSAILDGHVSPQMIDRIARETRGVFDVRKIRTGGKFARITAKDSLHRTLYFVYEVNAIDFVVYDFRDSLRAYTDKKKVTTVVKSASGTIKSSLWNAFAENKLDMSLGMALADVYAWTVDFYGLQKGDGFKVVYEEMYVDNQVIGIDRILASEFYFNGKTFYAYHFEQGGKGEYFDDQGNSLRRSFLKAPLKFSRISSRFSKSRMHPILRISRPHYGVDYSAPRGTPVLSLGDGRVTEVGWKGGYGRFVAVRHNSVYTSTYAHLSGYAKGLKAGKQVSQGEVIGYVGSSGLSTGAHLDFRVYKNGKPTDPLRLESPSAEPVKPANMEGFRRLVARMKPALDSIR